MEGCCSSMQLTRAADYAVRVMVYLASQDRDARVSLPDLASATGAPGSFLSKILQSLTRAHLITSRRGQSGGFQISMRGWQCSMLEVIESVDGPITLNVCLHGGRSCQRKATCATHPVWVVAQKQLTDTLRSAFIAELASARRLSVETEPKHIFHATL